jgi:protein-tyrosine phosphatase
MQDRLTNYIKNHNFRDVGGLPTTQGLKTKTGIIFRSDSLHTYSQNDINKIIQLGIKSVIDMRTPQEKKNKLYNSFDKQSLNIIEIPIYPIPDRKDQDMKSLMKEMFSKKRSNSDFESFMIENYRRMVFEHKEEVKAIIEIVSEPRNLPVIVHCNAGKDRTGFISYLVQSVSGVTDQALIDDYLLTNEYSFNNKEIRKLKYKIALLTFGRFKFNNLRPILEARFEYINFTMKQIKNEFRSVENYLIDFCKLSPEACLKIKSNFVN